jgi:hypothetical protein
MIVRTQGVDIAVARVGELWIHVSPGHPVDDATWREYLDVSTNEVKTNGPYAGMLVWAATHGPTTRQRRIMTEEYGEALHLHQQRRLAIITGSPIVRGIMTAMSWAAKRTKMRAFAPSHAEGALEWLAEDIAFDRDEAHRVLTQLRDEQQDKASSKRRVRAGL